MHGCEVEVSRPRVPIAVFSLLAAAIQVGWAGYMYGVGNQSIQIPFLLHLREPPLFANDDLLNTLSAYPSMLFRLLAILIPPTWPIEWAYAVLHFLTAWVTLLGGASLAVALTGRPRAGFWMVLLMAAGHHRGIAESGLYSLGFTHTGLAVAIGLFSLALALEDRPCAAAVTWAALMYVHPLYGAYVGILLGAACLGAFRRFGWRRLAVVAALALTLLCPLLPRWLSLRGGFDASWVELIRIRSPHHVFPSEWWKTGDPQVPALAALFGGAMLTWSFHPPLRRRIAAVWIVGLSLMGLFGALVAVLWPMPILLRAQLVRSSVYLVALLLAVVAGGLDAAIRAARQLWWRQRRAGSLMLAVGGSALCTVLALPALLPARPGVVVALAAGLWAWGRLSSVAAAASGIAWIVHALGVTRLGLPWIRPSTCWWANSAGECTSPFTLLTGGLGLLLLWALTRIRQQRSAMWIAVLLTLYLALPAYLTFREGATADWIAIQRFTAAHTPAEARILTPTVPGGFRIHSRRAVVAEWRDGTQQFFDPAFAIRWWRRIERIRRPSQGEMIGDLADLPEEEMLRIAADEQADFIVLPAAREARLELIGRNRSWALYRARARPEALSPPLPETEADPSAAQKRFLEDIVWPNIERYRKRDTTLRFFDEVGRPLTDARVRIELTRHHFGFGSSLPHFVTPAAQSRGFNAPLVDSRQLPYFLELFNYSVIAYSAKWDSIEPVRGQPDYQALDAYLAWCREHNIAVEFHFVTGYPPAWLESLPPAEQRAELLRHAETLISRYGDRVAAWQIVNERELIRFAPDLFKLFRERLPGVPLGVSHCARFHSERQGALSREEILNGWRDIEWLCKQGTPPDYFAFHGHRPFGLWADVRKIYEAFDEFANMGVRIRLTEFGVTPYGPIVGPVRRGEWTPELQAEYYRLVFLTAFSHPAVDAINIWGIEPRTWMRGAGLLDEQFRPKPVYHALRRLIREELSTRVSARVPLDGLVRFRGFYGNYRVEIERDGNMSTGVWDLTPETPVEVRFYLRGNALHTASPGDRSSTR